MKKIHLIVVVVLLLLLGCHRQYYTKDMSAIARWTMDYSQAIRTSDIDKLMSCFTDDVIFLPPNQSQLSGKENLMRWFLIYFNYYNPSETVITQNITVRGNLAYSVCRYSNSVRVKTSGEEIMDNGKLINIFERQQNRQWKCTHSIWNSNNPSIDLHAQIPADFSGTWKLDMSRSTNISSIISSNIFIVQRGNEIKMNRSYELESHETLENSFNCIIGHESKSNMQDGIGIEMSFWSPDKQSFTIVEKKNSGKNELKRTTTYSLTAKGETLNVYSDGILGNGSKTSKNKDHIELVYNRF
jgi:ketosteroid isomerase-like protein